jgi:hypothetical protein
MATVNSEGLTWEEWKNAVGISGAQVWPKHKEAWRQGEDPSDWRASEAAEKSKSKHEENAALARLRRATGGRK